MTKIHHSSRALAGGAALALLLAGCDNSGLTAINNNPNAPTTAPASAVFTNAVQSAVGNWLGATYDLRDIELLIQHLAENNYISADQYQQVGPVAQDVVFGDSYAIDLADFQVVSRAGDAAHDATIYAPAQIMQQWEYGYITDSWGDIPYSQALAADSSVAITAPAYDTQQDIYNGMFAKLTKDAADLSAATGAGLGAADPLYGGANLKWQRFANSLHARAAMRIVNADPAKANTELQAAFNGPGGVFTSNADNAQLNWPGDNVFDNPWADIFTSRDDHRMSKTFIDTLNALNDPRVAIYATPAVATGLYAGQPNGLTTATAVPYADSASRPGLIFYPGPVNYAPGNLGGSGKTQASYLMTYAELLLIEAEAAERGMGGLTPAQAAGFYTAGITASMNQWGITNGATIATYLAQPRIVYQGGTAGLTQIALQKWIALYTDGGQAWAEWRRTCVPNLVKAHITKYTYIPRRLEYPTSEITTNADQADIAAARMGGDANDTHVWWDKTETAPTCQ